MNRSIRLRKVTGQAEVEAAEHRLRRARDRLHDAERVAVGMDAFANRGKLLERGCDDLLRRLGIAGHGSQRQAAVIERHQHRVELSAVDDRRRIERLLHHLVIFRLDAFERDAMPRRGRDQRRHKEMRGRVAEQPQPGNGRRERTAGCARLADHLGEAVERVLVEPEIRQGLQATPEIAAGLVGEQGPATGDEILRFRGQQGEAGVQIVGHLRTIISKDYTRPGQTRGAVICALHNGA